MNIVILVKHAFITDFRPSITSDGREFNKQDMTCEMNDWDTYALEEAVKIKEQKGGYHIGKVDEFLVLLKKFAKKELEILFLSLLELHSNADPDDFAVIETHMADHVEALYMSIQNFIMK